jgi:sucrose-6-phosphate hydrolase SacC (GH32 family)
MNPRHCLTILAVLLFCGTTVLADTPPDILIADFEGTDYGAWKTTGEAFGPGPARGTLPGQMHVDGFKGQGLVNSFYGGDKSTGTLTSPEFKIERKFISFLIGGGRNPEKTCMNLLVDGKVVRNATGPNDQPGGSERLEPAFWDVTELAGKTAIIQILDNATGGWGHINIDNIVQTERKPGGMLTKATREFRIDKRYLNFPIKQGAPDRTVTMLVDSHEMERNVIGLADDKPDWWAFVDVSGFRGKTITIEVNKLPEDSTALSSIEQSDFIKGAENLYREPLRGQLHFSSRRGWNNDPNGLVFFNGEYHLFYQHNPYGWGWGNMHWGHAVSRDLVHWQELPDALAPDALGPMYSGSAVVDRNNTSGLGKDGKPPLVLIYTAAGNPTVQCIASSTDGRNFSKLLDNPVIKQITGGNRDPKVVWYEPAKKWVMVLYVELPPQKHTVHFFTSPNLRDWTLAGITEGGSGGDHYLFECPDFFELSVNGDGKKKWVLTTADSQYAVGSFNGMSFSAEQSRLHGQQGRGFYAAQTFSDIPSGDGRRIQVGWFQTETRGMPFNQSMTIPLELGLIDTPEGPRLTRKPVKELESLRAASKQAGPLTLRPGDSNPLADVHGELLELQAEFQPGAASVAEFSIRGVKVGFDAARQECNLNGHRMSAPLLNGRQRITIFADRTGLEVFASNGLAYAPMPVNLDSGNLDIRIGITGDPVTFSSLTAYNLRSIWE